MADHAVEEGFPICQAGDQLLAGRRVRGRDHDHVAIPLTGCPPASRAVGFWHTHPDGSPNPSRKDLSEALRLGLDVVCVTVPEKGITRCVSLRRGR